MRTLIDATSIALVLVLAACGVTGTSLADPADRSEAAFSDAPFTCALTARPTSGGTYVEGILTTNGPVNGSYDLRISSSGQGGGATIRQSGDVSARAGETVVLGSSQLVGTDRLNLSMTVSSNGRTTTCPIR